MTIAPTSVDAHHTFSCALAILGTYDIVVNLIFVVMRQGLRPPCVPYDAILVAFEVDRVAEESVVRLILCLSICLHCSEGCRGLIMEDDSATHGIATVHQ